MKLRAMKLVREKPTDCGLVHAVTTGQFREYVERRGDGTATLVWELETADRRSREQLILTSAQAFDMKRESLVGWEPWISR